MKSAYNYIWLYKHFLALNEEYKLRWQKDTDHISVTKLAQLLKTPPVNARVDVIGTDATAMLDHCKIPVDVVGSYRKYYILEKEDLLNGKTKCSYARLVQRRSTEWSMKKLRSCL